MPRTQRLIIDDETTVYHVMSGTAPGGFPLGDFGKYFMEDFRFYRTRAKQLTVD